MKNKHEITYVYMQYRQLPWIKDFRDAVDELIQKEYYDFLDEWIQAMDPHNFRRFLFFYSQLWLGIAPSPWGVPKINTFYDSGIKYDESVKYDNFNENDGFISEEELGKYISFLMDYNARVLNLDYLVSFCANYCKITKDQIEVTFKDSGFQIGIPSNALGLSLFTVVTSKNLKGLPFGHNIVTFQIIGDKRGDKK